jgi:hypothetical protein
MKARNLACKVLLSACFAMLLWAGFFHRAFANGGEPITPYKKGATITSQDIEKVRAQASSYRVISELRVKGTKVPLFAERVGFAYVTSNDKVGEPDFNLKGSGESGGDLTVPLSDVDSLTLIKVEERWFGSDRALLEVTVFPSCSSSELLQLNPTYSQLRESFSKKVRIWVVLENEKKGQLRMVGRKWQENYEVLLAIRDLELNVPAVFGWPPRPNAPIWWAVGSVIKDDKYPHRIIFLK